MLGKEPEVVYLPSCPELSGHIEIIVTSTNANCVRPGKRGIEEVKKRERERRGKKQPYNTRRRLQKSFPVLARYLTTEQHQHTSTTPVHLLHVSCTARTPQSNNLQMPCKEEQKTVELTEQAH